MRWAVVPLRGSASVKLLLLLLLLVAARCTATPFGRSAPVDDTAVLLIVLLGHQWLAKIEVLEIQTLLKLREQEFRCLNTCRWQNGGARDVVALFHLHRRHQTWKHKFRTPGSDALMGGATKVAPQEGY